MIVPAYGAWATLPAVLEALRPQMDGRDRQVIVVESSGELSASELERRWPWARWLVLPDKTLPGRGRNLGAQASEGELIAFLDADAIPDPEWLDELEHALEPGTDAVAGSVANGTPQSRIGTAGYLLEFADWLPSARGPLLHGVTCNLVVRRETFETLGGFHEDVFPGEDTIFTFPLAGSGRLAFAPKARVRHLNRTGLREFLRHQRRLGVAYGHVCARVEFPHRWTGRPAFAPLGVPFRLAALARQLHGHRSEAAQAVRLLPLLALGLVAWAVGLARAHS